MNKTIYWTDLHVVIEDGMLSAVFFKESPGIRYSEVFKVKEAMWMMLSDNLYKSSRSRFSLWGFAYNTAQHSLVDEVVILYSSDTVRRPALIKRYESYQLVVLETMLTT